MQGALICDTRRGNPSPPANAISRQKQLLVESNMLSMPAAEALTQGKNAGLLRAEAHACLDCSGPWLTLELPVVKQWAGMHHRCYLEALVLIMARIVVQGVMGCMQGCGEGGGDAG